MTKATLRELILAIALFFNPLGYNELFAFIMKLTGSYWTTSAIFYAIAGGLFSFYLILKKRNRNDSTGVCVQQKETTGDGKGS